MPTSAALLDEAEAIRRDLERRLRRQPRPAARAPLLGAANRAGRDKLVLVRRRLRHRRLRRLGRAADRRVDRQGRQGHPAGRRRVARPPRTSPRARADDVLGVVRPRRGCSTTSAPSPGWGVSVDAPARRADPALGVRHRRRRPDPRHQPVRPAQRRERQGRRPRAARRRPAPSRRRCSPTARSRSTRTDGLAARRRRAPSPTPSPRCSARLDAEHGYLAVHGLPRPAPRRRPGRRPRRRSRPRTGRPVTFGWGPRFLHSTGQYHKGGPPHGRLPADHRPSRATTSTMPGPAVHLRHASSPPRPPATRTVLADHGRPVLRLHLDRPGGRRSAPLREAAAVTTTGDQRAWTNPLRDPRGPAAAPDRRAVRAGASSASPATCPARS